MPYLEYNKPFLNNSGLVAHLLAKGLTVASVPNAEAVLGKINYYRFKAYLRPFRDNATKTYCGTDFSDGLALYKFDQELREFLFAKLARLEVKLRSRLDQVVTEHTNNPFWYLDDQLFEKKHRAAVNGVRTKISNNFERATEEFVLHFKNNFVNTVNPSFKHLPPFWIAAELTTFGNLPILYRSLDKAHFTTCPRSNKLDCLAAEFGAPNIKELNGWLLALREVRNRCAHHNRVWNANYRGPSVIPGMLSIPPSHPNRIYLLLALMHVMCGKIGLDCDIKGRLQALLAAYPQALNFTVSMGVPNQWETDPIWS